MLTSGNQYTCVPAVCVWIDCIAVAIKNPVLEHVHKICEDAGTIDLSFVRIKEVRAHLRAWVFQSLGCFPHFMISPSFRTCMHS